MSNNKPEKIHMITKREHDRLAAFFSDAPDWFRRRRYKIVPEGQQDRGTYGDSK